jgi:uncharacterized protein (TIGR00297 family)
MKGVLDTRGVLLALLFAAVLLIYGGPGYLALMLAFFILAIAVTKYEYEIKKDMGLYEHERGWENVLSNGLLPSALAFLSPITGPMPFIASIAAVTADKFGSELGVLDARDPVSFFNFRPVKPGTSGAMSLMGTVGSLAGAMAIGAAAILLFGLSPSQGFLIGLIGLAGSVVDTAFGVFEERGIGTKGTTNFVCSLAGAILAYYLIA